MLHVDCNVQSSLSALYAQLCASSISGHVISSFTTSLLYFVHQLVELPVEKEKQKRGM